MRCHPNRSCCYLPTCPIARPPAFSRVLRASLVVLLAVADMATRCVVAWGDAPIPLFEPLVPGAGVKLSAIGDDFEDPSWAYVHNGSKASHEQDELTRPPGGKSRNGRWYESAKRGHPDVIKRVPTPPGGPAGSRAALYLATKYSGVPGDLSGKQQQDDLLMSVQARLGRAVPVSWQPSWVVRVFLPEFSRWENRSGASFGVRADIRGVNRDGEIEAYWPGMFLLYRPGSGGGVSPGFAEIRVRARENGRDAQGPQITEPGWWTFGISFTPDGQIHQYAKPGLDDLTEADHLLSGFPYNFRCRFVDNVFFNVANLDNGKSWSTPWIVDNSEFFVVPPPGQNVAALMRQKGTGAPRVGRGAPHSVKAYDATFRK